MSRIDALRSYLKTEIEALDALDFIAIVPTGNPLHILEIGKTDEGTLQLSVPGRPRSAPEIPSEMRSALSDRGFSSKDTSDQTQPWVHPMEKAEACIDLASALHLQLFAEEPDYTLDILHGSHKQAHEAEVKLGLVRERVAEILAEICEETPEQDADGDFKLPIQDVQVTVAPRALPLGPAIVRVFAVTNVQVAPVPELGLFLARLNFSMMFGRFSLDTEHNAIWFDETLLGEHFSSEELRFAVSVVSRTADEWDDRLKQMFGGMTYQEMLKVQGNGGTAPDKPGAGPPGFYL
jgi:hypothetical protein